MKRFSRKHKTDEAHLAARAAYQADREAKLKNAKERQRKWAALSPQEQLAQLNRRLGKGVGAKKQRARLREKMAG